MRILVVDDSPIDSRITRFALEQIDDAVLMHAPDGRSALSLAEDFKPDLMLVDWNMPGVEMAGQTLIEAYRDHGGDARIIVTAQESERLDMIHGLRAGANHYVLKPFAPATLLRCITRVMSRKR